MSDFASPEVSRLRFDLHDYRQKLSGDGPVSGKVLMMYIKRLGELGACCCAICSYSSRLVDARCLNLDDTNV